MVLTLTIRFLSNTAVGATGARARCHRIAIRRRTVFKGCQATERIWRILKFVANLEEEEREEDEEEDKEEEEGEEPGQHIWMQGYDVRYEDFTWQCGRWFRRLRLCKPLRSYAGLSWWQIPHASRNPTSPSRASIWAWAWILLVCLNVCMQCNVYFLKALANH